MELESEAKSAQPDYILDTALACVTMEEICTHYYVSL